MSFGVKSTVTGDIGVQMTEGQKDLAHAITGAMRSAATLTKNNWRAQIVGAGLSSRLSNTVRSRVFPQFEDSMGPAALISVKGKATNYLLSELEDGAVISTARGRYLAIPTQNVPKGPGGTRLTPHALEALTGYHLRFVQNRRGVKMLVSDTVAAKNSRGIRPATRGRAGRKASATVMFILVPQVTIKKRLNLINEADRIGDQLASLIAERLS
ncbi:MAG TPA: hypothetical protein DEQ40_16415 [Oxalobacteraceae bacterium]|jgi:hypothetical protein|nr:hypothetical protein [Oxalobacteraceae bacterium]